MRTSTALAAALAAGWLAIAGASAALAQAALETGNAIEGAIDFHASAGGAIPCPRRSLVT